MSCLGVHFALTASEILQLKSIDGAANRLEHLQNVVEEEYFERHQEFVAESDKAWDAMHRALADGQLAWDGGEYPLNHVILGGEQIYGESDYVMSLKTPEQVRDIALALSGVTQDGFRRRYFQIDAVSYGFPLTQEDLEYTWQGLQNVRDLFVRAANANRFVLFTVDQ